MNDFDFEELDKAVSSLASKTDREPESDGTPSPTKPPKNIPIADLLKAQPSPPPKEETPKSVPISDGPHATPQPRPRMPQRGSFMDIVPPPAPRKSNTRVGPTLQPVSHPEEVAPAQTPAPDLSAKTPDVEPSSEPQHDAVKPTEAPTSDASSDVAWPDPLDFHEAPEVETQKKENEKPTSPFLAEAKVEKRPLGAFSAFGQATAEAPQGAEEKSPETEGVPASDEVVDELTPQDDGVFKEPQTAEEAPVAKKHESEPQPDMHSKAMLSIPQQYRTERKETDKAARPVFDTKEYHPPLLEAAVPKHHRTSIWTKLFIALVVLLLLGVAGYFVYIYTQF